MNHYDRVIRDHGLTGEAVEEQRRIQRAEGWGVGILYAAMVPLILWGTIWHFVGISWLPWRWLGILLIIIGGYLLFVGTILLLTRMLPPPR